MRIAIPLRGTEISRGFSGCEAIRVCEDDHGRVFRQDTVYPESGAEGVFRCLERCGADVLLCGELTAEETERLARSGVLMATGASGDADAALRRYLDAAIVCDPNNTCRYCAHRSECGRT